jgi:hypothetical protein
MVDIVDNSFKGGLRKPVKEIIKSLEDDFGELLRTSTKCRRAKYS